MSVNVENYEIRIDGKKRNKVLSKYKDDDGCPFLENFESGYYPIFRTPERHQYQYSDEYIIELIMKDFPDSEVFYRIVTDYGEQAYLGKNGKIKRLKKEWK